MKGRPVKATVDYFPHQTKHGRTISVLESMFGNDGYAAWFKVLELLGGSEGHYFRFEKSIDWLFLVSKIGVAPERAKDILDTMAELDAIDPDLYHLKVLWSGNFVEGLRGVYQKRSTETPPKPIIRDGKGIYVPEIRQSKVKESKEEKDIPHGVEKEGGETGDDVQEEIEVYLSKKKKKLSGAVLTNFNLFWKAYSYPKGKAEAADAFLEVYSPDIAEAIIAGAKIEAERRPELLKKNQTPKYAQGWLSGRRWEDDQDGIDLQDCQVCDYMIRKDCEGGRKDCKHFRPVN